MIVLSFGIKSCRLIGKPLHDVVIDVLSDTDALTARMHYIFHWVTFDLEEDRDDLLGHPPHI